MVKTFFASCTLLHMFLSLLLMHVRALCAPHRNHLLYVQSRVHSRSHSPNLMVKAAGSDPRLSPSDSKMETSRVQVVQNILLRKWPRSRIFLLRKWARSIRRPVVRRECLHLHGEDGCIRSRWVWITRYHYSASALKYQKEHLNKTSK